MSVVITSQRIYNQWTGTGGGGTTFLNQGVTSRIDVEIDFYISWNLTEARLAFDSAGTIAMLNEYDTRTFTDEGFQVDDTITVVNSPSNDGDFTITAISEDGRTITVAEAVTTENGESVDIHGTTPITVVDLYDNFIENSAPETYVSPVDPNTKNRLTAIDVDATEVLHETNFRARTKYKSWINFDIDNYTTGESSDCTIIGAGITDYKQMFTINKRMYVTPLYTIDQLFNFDENVAPDYYTGENSLKYIFRIEGRYTDGTPTADHYGSLTTAKGSGGWFDEANNGRLPEYYVSAIAYGLGGDVYDSLSVEGNTEVTITFKSRSGIFTNTSATKMRLIFYVCPDSESDYQLTTDTTLLDNFNLDRVFSYVGAPAVNGSRYGTSRQAITAATFTYVDANTVTVEFTFTGGSDLVDYWQGKEDNQRKYVIALSSEGSTVTTTKGTISNVARADFNSAFWDKDDSTLFDFVGSGIEAFEYPDEDTYGVGSIEGFEGDWWMTRCRFKVYNDPDADGNTPTVKQVKVQVIAYKTDNDDFVLEEKLIDCSSFRKIDDVQQLSVSDSRGFISYDDDVRNEVTLARYATGDTATMAAYELNYPLILRYEDWINAIDSQRLNADGVNTVPDVAKGIQDVTMKWANYSGINGWALKFKLTWIITGTDGHDNEFYSSIPIEVNTATQIIWSGVSGSPTQSLQYFDEDETEEINCLVRNGVTLVRCTWTGDFPDQPTSSGYYGCMLAVKTTSGTIFDQRFASTEVDSEEDSPWSATAADPSAATSYANGNLRINIYETLGTVTSIVVEGYFDSTYLGETSEQVMILPRLGAKYTST